MRFLSEQLAQETQRVEQEVQRADQAKQRAEQEVHRAEQGGTANSQCSTDLARELKMSAGRVMRVTNAENSGPCSSLTNPIRRRPMANKIKPINTKMALKTRVWMSIRLHPYCN